MKMTGLFGVVVLGWAGWTQTVPPPAALSTERPEPAPAVLPPQRLGPGDLVNVTVYAAPEMSGPLRIAADGNVRFPMLRMPIAASSMPEELAGRIAQELKSAGLLVDPLVTVTVTEYGSHPVSVTGAVSHPVTFQAYGKMTLLTAIAKADGFTAQAGPNVLVSIPANGAETAPTVRTIPIAALMNGTDPSLNLQLSGGEEIRVPEAARVYVLGNVRKPGAVLVKDAAETSVLRVLALSEGLAPFATKQAFLYRQDASGSKQEVIVPLSEIVARKSPDVAIRGGDIFYVPDNRGRRLTVSTLERIASFGSTTASGVLVWGR